MNTYSTGVYDLIAGALGVSSSAKLQGFLDNVMANKYNSAQWDGFSFAPAMQLDFTYEQIQKELNLYKMATYVATQADAIPDGTKGFSLSTGKIPRMKKVQFYDEDSWRKQEILVKQYGGSGNAAKENAITELFNRLDYLIGGHTMAVTYQRHQIVSAGKLELTNANNPRGIKDTFASHIPSANITTKKADNRWWTVNTSGVYSSEGTTCDPIADLQAMIDAADDKGVSAKHFEIDKLYAKQVANHTKVLAKVGAYLYPLADATSQSAAAAMLNYQDRIRKLGEILDCPFKIIDSIVNTEKSVKTGTTFALEDVQIRAFEANVIVLVPDGSLGEIHTVQPYAAPGADSTATYYGGRLLLTVTSEPKRKIQQFDTEMTTLVVPDKPQYMWYLHPYGAS
jgi:hypothetical protein